MVNGFVLIPREIGDRDFTDRNDIVFYLYLASHAAFKPTVFRGLSLKPGQLVRSYRKIQSDLGFSESQTRTLIRHLRARHLLDTQDASIVSRQMTPPATAVGVLFTLVRYSFQDFQVSLSDTPSDTPNDSALTPLDAPERHQTKKEIRTKGSNSKKEPVFLNPPSRAEVKAFCDEKGLVLDVDAFISYYQMRDWQIKEGTPLHDWRAAVGYWSKRKNQQGKTVLAQQYGQRQYSEGELDALGVDLIAEARSAREEGTV